MTLIRNAFTKTNMSWKLVIILSVVCGIIPGLLMVPEQLSGTSFQMPGISFEFWILAGLFISLNCHKPLDAGLKVFVFFLISQPLIYLVQVPFSLLGWGLFGYYPLWALFTVFTFPAGMLANLITRQKWWSVLILLIPMGILVLELPSTFTTMFTTFPKMSLTCLFIVLELLLLPAALLQGKGRLAVTYALVVVMTAASVAGYFLLDSGKVNISVEAKGAEPYELMNSDADNAQVKIEGSIIEVTYSATKSKDVFSIPIEYKDSKGNVYSLTFTKGADESGTFSEIKKE